MGRVRLPGFRVGVTILVALALALDAYRIHGQLALFGAGRMGPGSLVIDLLLLSSGTVVAGILSLSLLWRAHPRVESRTLALFLALLACFLSAQVVWTLANAYHLPRWAVIAADTMTPAVAIAGVAALVRFSSVFPAPLRPGQLALPAAGSVGRLRAALLQETVVWSAALLVFLTLAVPAQLVGIFGRDAHFVHPVFTALKLVVITLVLGALLVALANLRSGYRFADAGGRRRVFWLLEGFLAGGSLLLIASAGKAVQMLTGATFSVREWYSIVGYASFLVILAGLTIAMFFSGAIDPALAIRRTAVFGLVGITMIFIFAGVENAMQNLVAERLGMSDHLSGLVSGGLVALTFDPIKERFNHLVARWSGRAGGPAAHEVRTTLPPERRSAEDAASPHRPIAPSPVTDPEA